MKFRPPVINPIRLAAAAGNRLLGTGKPPAQPPGTVEYIGEKRVETLGVLVTEYDAEDAEFMELDSVDDCARFAGTDKVAWIHLTGLHDVKAIRKLGKCFGIHPLILEDIVNTSSRPKIEDHDDYLFVVAKLVNFDEASRSVDVQHFSLLLLPDGSVLTFLEAPTPVFDPVRQRIRTGGGGRIRKAGADYLAWALMDAVIDHYFRVIDGVDETIGALDEKLQVDTDAVEPAELYALKKEVSALHRLVRPIREIATVLLRSDSVLLTDYSRPYFRDLYDHALHVLESAEDLRELAGALRDFYLTAVSNRMNEVMKVLTSFATIFMPITFLAGIYGMNFEVMPELKFPWAYPTLIGVFLLVAATMFLYFRRKKWI